MAEPSKDRFLAVAASAALNGIDFVELVPDDALALRVHFINTVGVDEPGIGATIDGGDRVPSVVVAPIVASDWSADAEGRPLLTLRVEEPGDFSSYTLTLRSSRLDRFFAKSRFSFKALCPSDFDCAPAEPFCPPAAQDNPAIDYLAKDFLSFKQALTDFSALRHPHWIERSEADFGMMFLEALAAVADDFSYLQDRIAAEASLQTATERRSLVRHARLVDYEPRPATIAHAQIVCDVTGSALPAGAQLRAAGPDEKTIVYEVGTGLSDTTDYRVDPRWNRWQHPLKPLVPYYWDDAQRCLPRGATEMYVLGDGYDFFAGQGILIDTAAENPADAPIREIVHLIGPGEELIDPLFGNVAVTRIEWSADEALERDHDLTRTELGGNIVPVTQGERRSELFAIDPAAPVIDHTPSISRAGANGDAAQPAWNDLLALRDGPLAWIAQPSGEVAPEIELVQTAPAQAHWQFAPSLIDVGPFDPVFGIEPAKYRAVFAAPDGSRTYEYDGDEGETLRFGNGVFGEKPNPEDLFEVKYRVGDGAAGNVAADSITVIDPAWTGLLLRASNPFPARGGEDRESNDQIRRRAPQAFRAKQFRAVRAEDYERAAESLAWVQKAGTSFRWTGSWLTAFTTVDPVGTSTLSLDRHTALIHLLNRRRLAGYESYVPLARYVSIDLSIDVCAAPEAFPGDVERDVLDALGSSTRPSGTSGFFFADRFTFGTPLERSRLEAAIQGVPGVNGVRSIRYRRRGFVTDFADLPQQLAFGSDSILRIDNDPDYPERGSLRVSVEGGK